MYGECGGAGFYAKTLYRYWAANYASGGSFHSTKQDTSGSGCKVQVHGVFQNFGDFLVNYGEPCTLDVHGMDGRSYYSTNKILGLSLIFVIEPIRIFT